jgi:hypothetical protein
MWRYDNREPTAETTARTLLYLRAQIIRDGLDGLGHVEALLRPRGCEPAAFHVPPKRRRHFRNGGLRRAVLAILREGPMTAREVGRRLHERYQDMEQEQAIASAKYGLCALKKAVLVVNEGRVWSLNATGQL